MVRIQLCLDRGRPARGLVDGFRRTVGIPVAPGASRTATRLRRRYPCAHPLLTLERGKLVLVLLQNNDAGDCAMGDHLRESAEFDRDRENRPSQLMGQRAEEPMAPKLHGIDLYQALPNALWSLVERNLHQGMQRALGSDPFQDPNRHILAELADQVSQPGKDTPDD